MEEVPKEQIRVAFNNDHDSLLLFPYRPEEMKEGKRIAEVILDDEPEELVVLSFKE